MEEAEGQRRVRNILRGLGAAIGILALSLLLLFLPPFGTIVMVTFAPLVAGYHGARTARMSLSSRWLLFAAGAGGIWSLVDVAIIIALVSGFMGDSDLNEPFGLGLLAAISAFNIIFCILGARLGAGSRSAD